MADSLRDTPRKAKPICPRRGCDKPATTEQMLWSPTTRRMEPTLFCMAHAMEVEQDRREIAAWVAMQREAGR